MWGSGMNLITTVIGFGMSAAFIVFICTRIICRRIRGVESRPVFEIESGIDLEQVYLFVSLFLAEQLTQIYVLSSIVLPLFCFIFILSQHVHRSCDCCMTLVALILSDCSFIFLPCCLHIGGLPSQELIAVCLYHK